MAKKANPKKTRAENYHHPQAESPMRPGVGTQAQVRKKKPRPLPTTTTQSCLIAAAASRLV